MKLVSIKVYKMHMQQEMTSSKSMRQPWCASRGSSGSKKREKHYPRERRDNEEGNGDGDGDGDEDEDEDEEC
jgi:hypothetical protein